jgi:hypothetical protein
LQPAIQPVFGSGKDTLWISYPTGSADEISRQCKKSREAKSRGTSSAKGRRQSSTPTIASLADPTATSVVTVEPMDGNVDD